MACRYKIPQNERPHLTPENLVGKQYPTGLFGGIHIALIGYCPRPTSVNEYHPKGINYQPFVHVPPSSVEICTFNDIKFLSIVHIYGGVVSSALIEELAYYGIDTILSYGLAGGIGKNCLVGDYYIVNSALVKDGTTPHYTDREIVYPNLELSNRFISDFDIEGFKLKSVRALTDDTIYREYPEDLTNACNMSCEIVNCDSSHLFAVSDCVNIKSIECGVISNTVDKQNNELSTILTPKIGPMMLLNNIIRIYVERMIPNISIN